MEAALKSLFSTDKSPEGYSFQLVVWDDTNPEHWDDEFIFYSEDMKNDESVKYVTQQLIRFLDKYKKTPLDGKVAKKRGRKKKDIVPLPYKKRMSSKLWISLFFHI